MFDKEELLCSPFVKMLKPSAPLVFKSDGDDDDENDDAIAITGLFENNNLKKVRLRHLNFKRYGKTRI